MNHRPSRFPVAVSLLALVVSLASLLTTWRFTTESRIIDFAREKYGQIDKIERGILVHDKLLEDWENCPGIDPENPEQRAVLEKLKNWGQVQRKLLEQFKAIDVSSALASRLRLIEASSKFDSSGTEELARESRELLRRYCDDG